MTQLMINDVLSYNYKLMQCITISMSFQIPQPSFILKVTLHNIRCCRQRPLGTPCQSVGVDMSVSVGQLIAGRNAHTHS